MEFSIWNKNVLTRSGCQEECHFVRVRMRNTLGYYIHHCSHDGRPMDIHVNMIDDKYIIHCLHHMPDFRFDIENQILVKGAQRCSKTDSILPALLR